MAVEAKGNNSTARKTATKTAEKKAPTSKKTTAAKSSAGRKSQTGTRKAAASNRGRKPAAKKDTMLRDEILLWVVLAASIIILISNFGFGGFAGDAISDFCFGLFGFVAYLLPFVLFFTVAFALSNKGNRIAWLKTGAVFLLLISCSAIFELIVNKFDGTRKIMDFYNMSSQYKTGGGLIGGLLCKAFCPALGLVGAYVILVVLALISVVLITERSLFAKMHTSTTKVYDSAKKDAARRKEKAAIRREEAELKRQKRLEEDRIRLEQEKANFEKFQELRLDKKVTGVILDTSIKDGGRKKEDLHEVGAPSSGAKIEEFPVQEGGPSIPDIFGIYKAEEIMKKKGTKKVRDFQTKASSVKVPDELRGELDWQEETDSSMDLAAIASEIIIEGLGGSAEDSAFSASQPDEQPPLFEEPAFKEPAYKEPVFKEPVSEEGIFAEPLSEGPAGGGKAARTDAAETGVVSEMKNPRREKANPKSSRAEQEAELASVEAEILESEQEVKPEYVFPPIDLLKKPRRTKGSNIERELRETAVKLQQTLHNFGVNVTVSNVSCGPAVTRYELTPEQGVKVSRIVNLADDIKLNLAAADIRIEAPIPGKAAVGIEVPNHENTAVPLRELLDTDEFKNFPSSLAFAVGKDIGGKVVVTDIAKMPHLLIAGATGSGKSVCINTIIMSILYKADPEDVKLIMIDPKVVELSVYNGIPHLFIPVVTDPKKAAGALNWGVAEMTERYQKFAEYNVRDLKGYNAKIEAIKDIEDENKPKKLPQIVIIVDELADLMMVAPGEVEDSICRLAQLARAAGIHLIIATQRPSVNVITGLIKANMPSRIAFSVSSGVDSRTIIDMNGAEKLLGKGDMLFYPQGYQKPARVQGAFVSDSEVGAVVEFLTQKNDITAYSREIEEQISKVQQAADQTGGSSEVDAYFAEAGKFIIEKDKASIGMLQRVFKIGFNRAARIMDQLSDAGVVGPEEGTKPRKVLMSQEEFEQYIEEYV